MSVEWDGSNPTFGKILRWAKKYQNDESHVTDFTSQCLLSEICDVDLIDILANSGEKLNDIELSKFVDGVNRMHCGEPLDYVVGCSNFLGRRFFVDRWVLIPRPETEELVLHAQLEVSRLPIDQHNRPPKILDIGTGSGCIAISMAIDMPELDVTGWDICENALQVASKNARHYSANIRLKNRDVFDEFAAANEKYHMILSNPPYINAQDYEHNISFLKWEPRKALEAGADGLIFYRRLAKFCRQILYPGGVIICEIGHDQKEQVADIFSDSNWRSVTILNDCSGKSRILKAVF